MNSAVFNFIRITALLVLGMALAIMAAGTPCQQFSKVLKKEVSFSPQGTVSLSNKYGMIEVESWERQRVKFEISILVQANSEASAQRVFDRIHIDFSESFSYISASTSIREARQDWWFWGEEPDDYTIQYKVYIPASANLIAQNKHGGLAVGSIGGRAELSVRYGNLTAEKLATASITLEQGLGIIEEATRLQAKIEQAHLRIENVGMMEISSRFSHVRMEQVGEALTQSRYDTYKVERAGRFVNTGAYDELEIDYAEEINIRSRFTSLQIDKVETRLRLNIDSSEARVSSVGRHFREVDITGRYSDFRIDIEEGATYRMDAVADFAGIRYPRAMKVTFEQEHGTNHSVKGHCGSPGTDARLVRARLNYGALRVGED